MVDQVAKVLAQNSISIFYLATCNEDFILVAEDDLARSLSLLENVLVSK